jgi:signal transduction histidine kinase
LAAGQQGLNQVIQTLRSITSELRPPTLAPFGLEKAIRSHAERFQEAHPELELHFDLMSDQQKLPEPMRLALFRIYQQTLTNVIRHADARRVTIRLHLGADRATLDIEDDGRGFEVPARWIDLVRQGHLGLAGAVERAEAVGGQLKVVSTPGHGTQVQVNVPIQPRDSGPTR